MRNRLKIVRFMKSTLFSIRPDISKVVQSVASYSSVPKTIHSKTALFSRTLMVLIGSVLHTEEEQQHVFLWK